MTKRNSIPTSAAADYMDAAAMMRKADHELEPLNLTQKEDRDAVINARIFIGMAIEFLKRTIARHEEANNNNGADS